MDMVANQIRLHTQCNARYVVNEPGGKQAMRKNSSDYKYYHFDELGSTVNPYRYIGKYRYYCGAETNLYSPGKRYDHADAGVFCQRDAAKDGLSYYAYTSGNVMRAVDPWGNVCMVDLYTNNGWFGTWIFEHSLLYFPGRCKDQRTAGLYPREDETNVRIPDDQHSEYPKIKRDGVVKERAKVRKCNNDPVFVMFIDQCIKEGKDSGVKWQYFPYNCWAWTRDMWACASAKYSAYEICVLMGGNPEICKGKANMPLMPIIIAGVQ